MSLMKALLMGVLLASAESAATSRRQWSDRKSVDWTSRIRTNTILEKPLTKSFIVRSAVHVLDFKDNVQVEEW